MLPPGRHTDNITSHEHLYGEVPQPPSVRDGSLTVSSVIGAANALFTAGAAFGAIAQGFVADAYGRKNGMAIASVLAIIGGALAAGSVNIAMIVTVRIIQGIGAGMVICLVPLYLAETAPPQRRGFLSGLTVLAFGFGYEAQVRGLYMRQTLTLAAVRSFQSALTSLRTMRCNGDCLWLWHVLGPCCFCTCCVSYQVSAELPLAQTSKPSDGSTRVTQVSYLERSIRICKHDSTQTASKPR